MAFAEKLTVMAQMRFFDSRRSWFGSSYMSGRRAIERELALIVVRVSFAALLAVLFFSVTASGGERATHNLATIRHAAEDFIRQSLRADADATLFITAAEPDARLRLAECAKLAAFALNGAPIAARNTIGVRCDDARAAWTVYLAVTVEVERAVLVLRHSLSRDAHVGTDDVELQVRRIPGTGAHYPKDVAAIRNQHLRRGIAAGAILSPDFLTRDVLVKRGQEVALAYDASGIVIRAPGVALSDGGLADRVRVQNRTSLKVVEGTVESGNLVRVGM